MPRPPNEARARIGRELAACRDDPARFNRSILGRGPYWWRQRQIARSLVQRRETVVVTGNAVGKSYFGAGALLWFLLCHRNAKIVATAPSQVQLEEVLWKEVERSYRNSRIPLGGRLLRSPLKVDLGMGWDALAYSTTKTERLSGHHGEHLLFLGDEASGIPAPIYEAADSLNPSRVLLTGNPLWPSGPFYDRARRAEDDAANPLRLSNLIRIPSLESPDIHLERSGRGLADATWLAAARRDYGEGSIWWLSHVLAMFPDTAADALLPAEWLDLAGRTSHQPRGPAWCSIDLGGGNGGDRSTVLVRDDGGVTELESSRDWTLEETASRAAAAAKRRRVAPHRVIYDASGLGFDFGARLEAAGISGARGYVGGRSGGDRFGNLRSACAWALRQRLDPEYRPTGPNGLLLPRVPFAIRPDHLAILRPELLELRYHLQGQDRVSLEPKAQLIARLGHSPDHADPLIQSFAYPED